MERSERTSGFRVRTPDADLEQAWDRLAVATRAAPFARPGWMRVWADAFGLTVSAACLERDGDLVAVLPLVVDGRTARTAVNWHVPFAEVVARDLEAVVALLRGLESEFRRIVLDAVVGGSLTESVGSVVLDSRPVRRVERMHSPFIEIAGTWSDHVSTMSTKKVRELRRRRRRLAEQVGPVSYEVVDGAGPWAPVLEEGLAIEAIGWKGEVGTAIDSSPQTAAFYRGMAAWAARQKVLEIGVLRAGAHVVAFDLAVSGGSRVWLLKTGFDPAFAKYAPGQLLRHDALENVFDRGLDSFEFTGEAEPWKREWASAMRPIVMIDAHASGVAGRAGRLWERGRRAARVQAARVLRGSG